MKMRMLVIALKASVDFSARNGQSVVADSNRPGIVNGKIWRLLLGALPRLSFEFLVQYYGKTDEQSRNKLKKPE